MRFKHVLSYELPMQILADLGSNQLENKHVDFPSNSLHISEPSIDPIRIPKVISPSSWPLFSSHFLFLSMTYCLIHLLLCLRGEFGKWVAFIAVVLRLFFPRHFPGSSYNSFLLLTPAIIIIHILLLFGAYNIKSLWVVSFVTIR